MQGRAAGQRLEGDRAAQDFMEFTTREHMERAVLSICRPMLERLPAGGAQVYTGPASAGFSATCQGMEGLCRLLWGLAPLVADGRSSAEAERAAAAIAAGTDPEGPSFWGWPRDYDQRLVELAAIAYALLVAPGTFWDPLSPRTKKNVAAFLASINEREVRDNNWRLFRILANLALVVRGVPALARDTTSDWERLDSFYLGDGWYSDGAGAQCDYYVAFAIHFYSLIFARFADHLDQPRASRIRERAGAFAEQFAQWFSSDGQAVPYGRSLTYRWAQSAFWAALAYATPPNDRTAVAKGLLLRNLRWWVRQSVFTDTGLLSIGYCYPNPSVGEIYTSTSSPYWALKSFLPLALPNDHLFWTCAEEPLPIRDGADVQARPRAIVCRHGAHVFVLPGAPSVPMQHRNAPEKYAKFCYSSHFGFSIPVAPRTLEAGAHDSSLAFSTDGEYYRVRARSRHVSLRGGALELVWHPWPEVEVTTWLVPALPWHVRIHRVQTPIALVSAEGGFAIPLAEDDEQPLVPPGWPPGAAAATRDDVVSVVIALEGRRSPKLVRADVNTHLLHRRTVIPTLVGEHAPGSFWLACAVVGTLGAHDSAASAVPSVSIDSSTLLVHDASRRELFRADLLCRPRC